MLFIVAHKLIKFPARVRKISLTIPPKAHGTKNSPSIAPLATTRHRTSAEIARAINDSRTIQVIDPRKIDPAIHRFAHSHETPLNEAWKKKISRPGTHVISDRRNTITAILPS